MGQLEVTKWLLLEGLAEFFDDCMHLKKSLLGKNHIKKEPKKSKCDAVGKNFYFIEEARPTRE